MATDRTVSYRETVLKKVNLNSCYSKKKLAFCVFLVTKILEKKRYQTIFRLRRHLAGPFLCKYVSYYVYDTYSMF